MNNFHYHMELLNRDTNEKVYRSLVTTKYRFVDAAMAAEKMARDIAVRQRLPENTYTVVGLVLIGNYCVDEVPFTNLENDYDR